MPAMYVRDPETGRFVPVGGGGGSAIDDTTPSTVTVYSSKKTQDEIDRLDEQINEQKEANEAQDETIARLQAGTFIDYDDIVKNINHRGWNSSAPENTIPAFILSKKQGYKYVECDVRLTSDGVPVLLHDATIDRTSDGSGNIADITYAEVLAYDFGSWKSSEYAGVKIPTFNEFCACCRSLGLHPYVHINGTFTEAQIQNLVNIADSYGLGEKTSWIYTGDKYLTYIKNCNEKARLLYSPADITSDTIAIGKMLMTGKNEVVMNVDQSRPTAEKVSLCIANGFPLEIYTVDSQSAILAMNNYVSGVTSNNLKAGKILYESFSYTAPEVEAVPCTGITLDQSVLTFTAAGSQTLTATVTPDNTTDKIVWSSDNTTVASVISGVVTAKANGSAVITATCGSYSATCEVTVSGIEEVTPGYPTEVECVWLCGYVGAGTASSYQLNSMASRAAYVATSGDLPIKNYSGTVYPVPVPDGATSVVISSPEYVCSVNECKVVDGAWTKHADSGWLALGGATYTFKASPTHIVINAKYGTAGSAAISSIPDTVTVTFA